MFWHIFLLVSGLKLLFIPAYRSTDFEVHRNWLAITHSLPLSRWYYEKTSEWTLDYPPLFAYFEWALSQVAKSFDSRMLDVKNLYYASDQTILFQRFSVIVMDVVYALGVRRCLRALTGDGDDSNSRSQLIGGALLLGNAGLLMVDHIHFQYNGFLFGVLLLSIGALLEGPLQSAALFAVLLNLKHIFIYVAPVYVVYLLRFYCLRGSTPGQALMKLIKLGTVVLAVCLLSFGPFYAHLPQVLSRLFPFKRGLTHAYWAPNFWALYNAADKVLSIALGRREMAAGTSSGLVQTYDHSILPSISPMVTFVLTGITMLPAIIKLWSLVGHQSNAALGRSFIRAIVLCGCTSFLFGWHVHEKAILMVLIPLTLLSIGHANDARWTIFLGIVAHYSLFPLLFKPELTLIKISLTVAYTTISVLLLKLLHRGTFFHLPEFLYLSGFPILAVYENLVHDAIGLRDRLPFIPLLLTSVYCAVGVLYFWLSYHVSFLTTPLQRKVTEEKKKKT